MKTLFNLLKALLGIGILLLADTSFAQSGAIQVNDEFGQGLAGVYIQDLTNPAKNGITEYGKFRLTVNGFSDKLSLKRFGYKDKIVDLSTGSRTVALERAAYPNGYLYFNSFDDLPTGLRTNKYEIIGNFDTYTQNGLDETNPTQSRIYIDNTQDAFGGTGKSLRVKYPKGKNDAGPSGAQWRGNLQGQYNELYLSYWVKVETNFDFTLGGKLPGFSGSPSYLDNSAEFSSKQMWRDNGKLEFYLHPTSGGVDNGTSDAGKIRDWWDNGGQVSLRKGKWEYIEIYNKLNTPGSSNGIMRAWVNGVLKGEITNVTFRGPSESNVQINQLFFSTFFGGDATYAPNNDLYAWFDDFRVSKTKIGTTTRIITAIENQADVNRIEITKTGVNSYTFGQATEWILLNQLGQIMSTGNQENVNVSNLPNGQYFIKHNYGTYKLVKLED
jgi:hypothetical protein